MLTPDFATFKKLARKGNLIPLCQEVLADMETPVSAFLKLTRGLRSRRSFLLESVVGGERIARYSYLGADPGTVLETRGGSASLWKRGRVERRALSHDPLAELKKLLDSYRPAAYDGLPPFWGGAVGFMGYDNVRFFEPIPDKNPDPLKFPDTLHFITDTLVAFDHVEHLMKVVVLAHLGKKDEASLRRAYALAQARVKGVLRRLATPAPKPAGPKKKPRGSAWSCNLSKAEFVAGVGRCLEYIKAGDIFQVQFGRRLSKKTPVSGFSIYRQLRRLNPSPYLFYFQDGDRKLIGSSPEILVKVEGPVASIRPIAGTRRRGLTPEEDRALEAELIADPKERAEHIMLVDLARNDLGRISKAGTVKVTEMMVIERYSHVLHLVSDVLGQLKPGLDCFDVLRASFPAGTVTGAPKIRAMQIIDELENIKRGPYGGALGTISFSGDLSEALVIRTLMMDKQNVFAQAAAGIVADSKADLEYKETESKLKAVVKAVDEAEKEEKP